MLVWAGVIVVFVFGLFLGASFERGNLEDEIKDRAQKKWAAEVKELMDKERKGAGQICTRCGNPVGCATLAIGGKSKWVCEWCGMIQAGEGEEAAKGALPM